MQQFVTKKKVLKRDPCVTVGPVLGYPEMLYFPTCSFFHFSIPYKNLMLRPDKAVFFFQADSN